MSIGPNHKEKKVSEKDMMSSEIKNNYNNQNTKKSEPLAFTNTPSVDFAKTTFRDEKVSSSKLCEFLLKNHPDYAKGRPSNIELRDTIITKTVDEWINEITTLFDLKTIIKISKVKNAVYLHGRLVIIGLCLLDSGLRIQLGKDEIYKKLVAEIWEKPFGSILSKKGNELFHPPQSLPNQPDNPIINNDGDYLGRYAYAKYLCKRIEAVPENTGAYSIHLYGPWGSGKSTLLNFTKKELLLTGNWLVAEYNAWRHQHIQPPWWSLINSIYNGIKKELKYWFRAKEYILRISTGKFPYIIGFIVLAWVFVVIVSMLNNSLGSDSQAAGKNVSGLKTWAETADAIGKIVATILSVWGIIIAFSQSALQGSASAAKSYMDTTHDPMETIKSRIKNMIGRTGGKKVVVFIDDLDRCQSSFVVQLLEGIQTLFREIPVVFVVAADLKWLNACYEETYSSLKPFVNQPGKGLGFLFLEKLFQFATPVPGIPKEMKDNYWKNLIGISSTSNSVEMERLRTEAKKILEKADSEFSFMESIEASKNESFLKQIAIREEAVIRLATPEFIAKTEHALLPFCDLLEPNPRAMKRLVNTYSVNRTLSTLLHLDIEMEHLALWTILTLRWPTLGEYLERFPEKAEAFYNEAEKNTVDKEVKYLFDIKDIIDLVQGEKVPFKLNVDIIKKCSYLNGEE